MNKCSRCGTPLPPNTNLCPLCGADQEQERRTPLSTMDCVGILLAGLIPLIGPVILYIWAFGRRSRPARKSLARAVLILHLAALLLLATLLVHGVFQFRQWEYYYEDPPAFDQYPDPGQLPDGWDQWEDWGSLPDIYYQPEVHPLHTLEY